MEKRHESTTVLPTYVQGLTSEVAHTLSSLPGIAFLSIFFLGLLAFHAHGAVTYYQGLGEHAAFVAARFMNGLILTLLYFSLVVLAVTLIQELVFKFQVFFAFLLWLQGVILVGALLMIFVFIVAGTFTAAEDPGGLVPETFVVVACTGLILTLVATLIHIHFLRQRTRDPHAKKRPRKVWVDLSPLRRFKMLWIAAAIVLVVLNALTLGRYILFSFFAVISLFLVAVVTSLPVEMGYSAYLRATDETFREQLDTKILWQDRKNFLKKAAKWLLILLVAVAALLALDLFF